MNKKVALSLLSATVFASMAASAFAAPKSGVYMGGDVDRYYALTDLFKLNDAGYAKFQSDLAKTKFENLIFVDHDGKGASLKEILSSTQDFEKIKRDLKQNDFEGEYAKSNLDGTNGESYDPRKDITPEPTGDLKVESVSAINPLELQVKFNQAVDADSAVDLSNYVITVNGTKYGTGFTALATLLDATPNNNVAYNEDTKTVTFRLAAGNKLSNGTKYTIDVKDGVLSEDKSKKVGRFAGEQQTFSDTAVPQLVKAEKTASNFLKLTFNEPVTAGLTATVDGVSVALAAPSTTIGDYTVQSAAALPADLRTAGVHNVSVYNATDVAAPNSNSKNILTGSFQVTGDTTPPAVVEVKQVSTSDRAFDIKFSEAVTFDPSKLVIKKGNFTFPAVDGVNSPGYTLSYLAADKVTPATVSTATYVRVTFGADSTAFANNLYGTSENSVNLEVTVENYKDGVNLVGAKDTKTVALAKNLGAPKVASKYDNSIQGTIDNVSGNGTNGYLAVKFDKAIGTPVSSKIVVTDKDGITRTATATLDAADATNKTVKLVITNLTDRDDLEAKAPFNVSFAAGAVKATNNIENTAFSTQVEKSSNIVAPVVEAVAGASVTNNVVTVTYNTAVDASAVNLANYTLDGVAFPAGTTISINGANTVVTITLPEGYTNRNITKLFEISKNVKTANGSVVVGSVATKAPYSTMLSFTDNTKPVLTGAKFLVTSNTDTASSKIKLSFSEKVSIGGVDPTKDFDVTVNGSAATVSQVQDGTAGDEYLTLVTNAPINLSQPVVITVNGVTATNTVVDVTDGANTLTTGTVVSVVGTELDAGAIATDAIDVATAKAGLGVTYTGGDSAASVTGNLTLPTTGAAGTSVSWSSSDAGTVSNTGVVVRPATGAGDKTVTLTATITKGTATDTKTFTVVVKEIPAVPAVATNLAAQFDGLVITNLSADVDSTVTKVDVYKGTDLVISKNLSNASTYTDAVMGVAVGDTLTFKFFVGATEAQSTNVVVTNVAN